MSCNTCNACSTSSAASTVAEAVENLCRPAMESCQSCRFTDTRNCLGGCSGEPIAMAEPQENSQVTLERCCDQNGCCALYQRCCRNPFWPSFSHPSWLCCRDLYRQ